MVASHTASAYTAESHTGSGQVNDGIIDAAAAEGNSFQNPLFYLPLCGKQIQRQRFAAAVHKCFHIGKILVCQYRQNGTENLLLHNR